LDFTPDADGIDALVIGKQLSGEWKLAPGDYVTLLSPQGRLTPFGMMPRTRRFRVTGVFDSGFYDYDENWCFMTLLAAQGLSGAGDVVNVLEFRLQEPQRAQEIAKEIAHAAGDGFLTSTWMEQNRALFRALRLEELKLSARVAAGRVRETQTPFRFNAMSSRERRILHLVLKEEPGVRSESEGSGEDRQVVVYPAS